MSMDSIGMTCMAFLSNTLLEKRGTMRRSVNDIAKTGKSSWG